MKLNKILMALSAMAIVGCSSEDFNDPSVAQAIDDSRLIQLDENFILAGVGEVNTTRTHWDTDPTTGAFVNQFLPIWATLPSAGDAIYDNTTHRAKLDEQRIGLCWLGNGAVGTDVYTNYEFYHFGWLNNGETAADLDKCGSLYNGALYDEITVTPTANDAANGEADKAGFTGYTVASGKTGTPSTDLNFNSGVYKTENKAIFGGQYIVYYPYNPDFEDAGTIPAVAETNWANVPTDWKSAEIGKATFRYSAPVTIEGGHQAANFGLKNLSAIAQLRVASVAGDPCVTGAQTIDQIVLYSASGKLLKQANLAADKIAAGATGANLYAATEGTKTIVATATTPITLLAKESTTITSAYITVLPTTVDDLVALVHNTNGKWAQISLGNTEFKAGSAKRLDIIVKDADFTTDFIAVDEASLTASLTAARAVPASATAPQTITVIGDITLASPTFNINTAATDPYITIKGDDIIVPEGVTLNLNTNMESEVRVLGTSCCSGAATGGRVDVQGGTISDVTMEPTEARVTAATYDNINPQITYSAAATVAAGKTIDVQAGNVIVNAAVEQKEGNIQIAEGAKVTVSATGNLSFLGTTVDNYGTIEVKKAGQFYMKNANGTSVWTDGQKMTNRATGKFIHNVDAVVGTAVQFMNQETGSEYRCRVDKQKALDDAYVQWTACSVIEMVNSGAITYDLGSAQQHTIWSSLKHVDIEVNNGTGLTTFQKNADGTKINIGNLTVLTTLDVDDQPKADGTQRELIVNGDMTVSANTNLKNSKKITVTKNLDINNGATLKYYGIATTPTYGVVNGLEVDGDITVTGATFNASDNDAIQISCKNFSLVKGAAAATATFGNRTAGNTKKSMEVKGTISNGKGCIFTITAATGANLLAWITCYKVEGEGTFAGTPTVIQPE